MGDVAKQFDRKTMDRWVYREILKKNLLPFWKRNRALFDEFQQDNDPKHASEDVTPKSQHSGDEVAKPERRSQPHRAFMGSSKAPRPWKKV